MNRRQILRMTTVYSILLLTPLVAWPFLSLFLVHRMFSLSDHCGTLLGTTAGSITFFPRTEKCFRIFHQITIMSGFTEAPQKPVEPLCSIHLLDCSFVTAHMHDSIYSINTCSISSITVSMTSHKKAQRDPRQPEPPNQFFSR